MIAQSAGCPDDDLSARRAFPLRLSEFEDGIFVVGSARHDLVDAVFALEGQDDLLMIVRRVEALARFLGTEDGANLLAGTKRATNILRIEEKKDGRSYAEPVDRALLHAQGLPEEKVLAEVLDADAALAAGGVQATYDVIATSSADGGVTNYMLKVGRGDEQHALQILAKLEEEDDVD